MTDPVELLGSPHWMDDASDPFRWVAHPLTSIAGVPSQVAAIYDGTWSSEDTERQLAYTGIWAGLGATAWGLSYILWGKPDLIPNLYYFSTIAPPAVRVAAAGIGLAGTGSYYQQKTAAAGDAGSRGSFGSVAPSHHGNWMSTMSIGDLNPLNWGSR